MRMGLQQRLVHALEILLLLVAAGMDTVVQQRWHMSPTAHAAWADLHVALELGPGGHLDLGRVDHGTSPFAIEFWSRSPVPSELNSRTSRSKPWICVGTRCCCITGPTSLPHAGGRAWQQFVVAFRRPTPQSNPQVLAVDGSMHTIQTCITCTDARTHSRGSGRAMIGSVGSGRALLRFVRWWSAPPSEQQLAHLFHRGFTLGPSALDTSGLRLMFPLLGTYEDVFGTPAAMIRGPHAWKQLRMQPTGTSSSPPQQQSFLLVDGSVSQPLHLIAHSFSSEFDPLFLIYLDWILHVLLARLHRPVLWTVARCRCTDEEAPELRASPYCCSLDGLLVRNHSLLLVNAHSTPRLDFASLSKMLRRRNVRDVGVFHLNHERPWARAPSTAAVDTVQTHFNAADAASMRSSSFANVIPRDVYPPTLRHEYGNFNYALRTYFYEPFVDFAQYVPLGPAKLRPDVPVGGIGEADRSLDAPNGVWGNSAEWSHRRSTALSRRPKLCSFAGSLHAARTSERIALLQQLRFNDLVSKHCEIRTSSQADLMHGKESYMQLLFNSQFVLCPSGNNPETFRLYESLEAGAIPIVVRAPLQRDFFRAFAIPPPFPVLESWTDVGPELERLHKLSPNALDAMQRDTQMWYATVCAEFASDVAKIIGRSFTATVDFNRTSLRCNVATWGRSLVATTTAYGP